MNLRVKMVVFGKLELNRRSRRNNGSNVATSHRRDAWSTEKIQQVTQRRDVSTSRRHRDFCLIIIRSKGDLILRHRRTCELERGKQSSNDLDHWRRHFLFVFLLF